MRNRRWIALLIAALLACTAAGCATDAGGDDNVLTVAMECSYAPYNWTQPDESNGAVPIRDSADYAYGYDVMMAKYLANRWAWSWRSSGSTGIRSSWPCSPARWTAPSPAVDHGQAPRAGGLHHALLLRLHRLAGDGGRAVRGRGGHLRPGGRDLHLAADDRVVRHLPAADRKRGHPARDWNPRRRCSSRSTPAGATWS